MKRRSTLIGILLLLAMCGIGAEVQAQILNVRRVPSLLSSRAFRITEVSKGVLIGFDEVGFMIRTVDSCKTWKRVDTTFRNRVKDLRFVDHERGYAIGDSSLFLRTDDGGVSWTPHVVIPNRVRTAVTVYPLSRDTVLALFRGVGDTVELMRSDDAGESWSMVTEFVNIWYQSRPVTVGTLCCFDAQHWTVFSGNGLLRTTDAGRTWIIQYNDRVLLGPAQMEVVNDSVGIAFDNSVYGPNEVELAKTTDAGATWSKIVLVPGLLQRLSLSAVRGRWFRMNSHGQGVSYASLKEGNGCKDSIQDGPISPMVVHTTTDNWETWRSWPVDRPPLLGFISGCIDENGVFTAIGIDNVVYRSHIGDDTLRMITPRLVDGIGDAMMITKDTWVLRGLVFHDRHVNATRPRGFTNVLVRTTDAGETWSVQDLNQGMQRLLNNSDETIMSYYNDTIIRPKLEYADDRSQFVTAGTKLYRTTDGGASWASVYTHDVTLKSVSFGDSRVGFAIDSLKRLYRTTDSGSTFSRMPNHTTAVTECCAVDANVVFASDQGRRGILRKSTDGGETWSVVTSDSLGEIYSIDAYNEDRIVVSRFASSSFPEPNRYWVYSTWDGGLSWSKSVRPDKGLWLIGSPAVRYLTASSILSVTMAFDDLSTCDGGVTWYNASMRLSQTPRFWRGDMVLSNAVDGTCLSTGHYNTEPSLALGVDIISGCGVPVGVEETESDDEAKPIVMQRSSCEIVSKDALRSQLDRAEEPTVVLDLQGRVIAHLDEVVIPYVLFLRTATRSRVVMVVP